jgi:hypothetical protein
MSLASHYTAVTIPTFRQTDCVEMNIQYLFLLETVTKINFHISARFEAITAVTMKILSSGI